MAAGLSIVRGPLGFFRPVVTRDATALDRADQPFLAANLLSERTPAVDGSLYEIKFVDGTWMLAREADLTFY